MREATGQAPKTLPPSERTSKNADAVTRGRKGGKVGGKARGKKLSAGQRAEIATTAALARWKKTDGELGDTPKGAGTGAAWTQYQRARAIGPVRA
jgi:hypothetical protein